MNVRNEPLQEMFCVVKLEISNFFKLYAQTYQAQIFYLMSHVRGDTRLVRVQQ